MTVQEALRAYARWVRFNQNAIVTFTQEPELPFANLLQAWVDAMAHVNFKQYPIIIKFIHQTIPGAHRSISEIISWKINFCVQKNDEGMFVVKKSCPLWYRCQSIMALKKVSEMTVICFNPKTNEILPIVVNAEPGLFIDLFVQLSRALDIFDIEDDMDVDVN